MPVQPTAPPLPGVPHPGAPRPNPPPSNPPPSNPPRPGAGDARGRPLGVPPADESRDRDEPAPGDGEQLAPDERQRFEEGAMRERDA